MPNQSSQAIVWKLSWQHWLLIVAGGLLVALIFSDGLILMKEWWFSREEYSHGPMIPLIVLFLIWQKKNELESLEFKGSWIGFSLVVVGLALGFLGELGSVYTVIQYAFLLTVFSLFLTLTGVSGLKPIAVPLLLLAFMIPLPSFLYHELSAQSQLVSSQLGVAFIRLFDISVYLEGNVIDLGSYKLQVVDACSGLRYLFPLMTLGLISAYIFNGPVWKKAVIFLSTIPITIIMNSIRIGIIGVTVEYWGIQMAEGLLHDLEGWVMFMGCLGILIIEMWALAKIGDQKLPLVEAFGLEFPEPIPENAEIHHRKVPKQLPAALIVIAFALIGQQYFLDERTESIPDREAFSGFPLDIDEWKGKDNQLEQIFIDKLKLSDHVLVDYFNSDGQHINFYSAYYESQRKDAATHSPSDCLPGAGWVIAEHDYYRVNEITIDGEPLIVNRLLIKKGDLRQLVYYWYQQRGRVIPGELSLKWYFMVDSISKNRSDGALVRLTTQLPIGETITEADNRLTDFAASISPLLPAYIPN